MFQVILVMKVRKDTKAHKVKGVKKDLEVWWVPVVNQGSRDQEVTEGHQERLDLLDPQVDRVHEVSRVNQD